MMRGRIFCNGSIFGSSIFLSIFTVVILYLVNITEGKKLISHIPNSKVNAFKVSGSLRYLSKAVFTKAIVGDSLPIGGNNIPVSGGNDIPAIKRLARKALLSSNQEDSSDCTKRLLCELQTKENLSWDEELLKNAVPSQIDYTSPTLQMNVAVALGRNNPQQCGVVYNRCQYDGGEIMNFLRKSGTSIEIDSDDLEYECNVLFLWTKKNKTVIDTVKRHTSEIMGMNLN